MDQLVVDEVCMRLSAGVEVLNRLDASVRTGFFGDSWTFMWGYAQPNHPWLPPHRSRDHPPNPGDGHPDDHDADSSIARRGPRSLEEPAIGRVTQRVDHRAPSETLGESATGASSSMNAAQRQAAPSGKRNSSIEAAFIRDEKPGAVGAR